MDEQTFWRIIEETHDTSMEKQERKLQERLSLLSCDDILQFDRFAHQRCSELFTWELWGVAYLARGGCSDDGFMDWRFWIVYCGKETFEIARDRPDDLVPVIDAHPDAGLEGIGYVPQMVLDAKDPNWKEAAPEPHPVPPTEPSGTEWEDDDLEELLPKAWVRFKGNEKKPERPWWKFWK